MLENEMPGAALEAPDTFMRLAAPLWPRLPLALGYTGGARWVAFYLALEDVTYNDGASAGTGDTSLFLAFKRHPVMAPSLSGAHLGSIDDEASDWLVVDCQEQVLYLAAQAAARWHLVAQWPRYQNPPLEYTRGAAGPPAEQSEGSRFTSGLAGQAGRGAAREPGQLSADAGLAGCEA